MLSASKVGNPCHFAFAVVVSLLNVVRAYMAIWAAEQPTQTDFTGVVPLGIFVYEIGPL